MEYSNEDKRYTNHIVELGLTLQPRTHIQWVTLPFRLTSLLINPVTYIRLGFLAHVVAGASVHKWVTKRPSLRNVSGAYRSMVKFHAKRSPDRSFSIHHTYVTQSVGAYLIQSQLTLKAG